MKNGILKFDSKVYIILHTDYNSEKFLNYKSSDYFRRKTTINKQKRQGKICYHWSKNSWNFWFVVSKLVLECGEQDTNDCFIKNRSKHSSNILLSLLQFFMKQTLVLADSACFLSQTTHKSIKTSPAKETIGDKKLLS